MANPGGRVGGRHGRLQARRLATEAAPEAEAAGRTPRRLKAKMDNVVAAGRADRAARDTAESLVVRTIELGEGRASAGIGAGARADCHPRSLVVGEEQPECRGENQ